MSTHCPRCGGFVHHGADESFCLQCAYRLSEQAPDEEPETARLRSGGDLGGNGPFMDRSRPPEQQRQKYDNRLGRRTG